MDCAGHNPTGSVERGGSGSWGMEGADMNGQRGVRGSFAQDLHSKRTTRHEMKRMERRDRISRSGRR